MLADKYQFSHLFHLCQEKICNQIDSENVINVIKASYLLGNEKMMAKAIAFLASSGKLWQTFGCQKIGKICLSFSQAAITLSRKK